MGTASSQPLPEPPRPPPPSPPSGKLRGNKNLLLVGKTGQGKSSTGNTIVGQKVLFAADSGTAVTLNATLAVGRFDGYTVRVIDTPGIKDMRVKDRKTQKDRAVRNFIDGFVACSSGFHAVLVVVRYSGRFSSEDQEVIDLIREVFGPDILRRHGIVLFTRGEDFIERNGQNYFGTWCNEQEGPMHDLIRECNNRVVLFSNLSSELQRGSREGLFKILNSMKGVYTQDMLPRTE